MENDVVAHVSGSSDLGWRRNCGCLKTSDKLKNMLARFPVPPPPTPVPDISKPTSLNNTCCISAYCTRVHHPLFRQTAYEDNQTNKTKQIERQPTERRDRRTWRVIGELVQLLQLSVTATALAFYYVIYCYMQLVYYTLWSAIYFHNADGPMKITIGIVTITSLIIGFNLIVKFERYIGLFQ
ncbi:uncharacterized protein LOC126974145 isoform X2 [Leptidea sinapis]|nr:uncharacterized protein LOC126974145 isoform X2 [Leptidea sinapis]